MATRTSGSPASRPATERSRCGWPTAARAGACAVAQRSGRREEEVAFVSAIAGGNAVSLGAAGDRIRVDGLWPGDGDEPLELPGFEPDHDEKVSTRTVERDEAVATARAALAALGVDADGALLIHLGA
jgi:hypothetical protein